jgi:hypothetical protein
MHQPVGEIEPSTILHVPVALVLLPGMKELHPEHCLPSFGVVW